MKIAGKIALACLLAAVPGAHAEGLRPLSDCNNARDFCGDFSDNALRESATAETSFLRNTREPFRALANKLQAVYTLQDRTLRQYQDSRRAICREATARRDRIEASLRRPTPPATQCNSYRSHMFALSTVQLEASRAKDSLDRELARLEDLDSDGLQNNKQRVLALAAAREITEAQKVAVMRQQVFQVWKHSAGPLFCRFHGGILGEQERLEKLIERLEAQFNQMAAVANQCGSAGTPPPAQ